MLLVRLPPRRGTAEMPDNGFRDKGRPPAFFSPFKRAADKTGAELHVFKTVTEFLVKGSGFKKVGAAHDKAGRRHDIEAPGAACDRVIGGPVFVEMAHAHIRPERDADMLNFSVPAPLRGYAGIVGKAAGRIEQKGACHQQGIILLQGIQQWRQPGRGGQGIVVQKAYVAALRFPCAEVAGSGKIEIARRGEHASRTSEIFREVPGKAFSFGRKVLRAVVDQENFRNGLVFTAGSAVEKGG